MNCRADALDKFARALLVPALAAALLIPTARLRAAAPALGGPAFSDPSHVEDMPPQWERQPIKHQPGAAAADLVVNMDQQMFRLLSPYLREYARERKLKIAIGDSTCGNSAALLAHKNIDIGAYCCPPAASDRLPGLRFHTLGIAAVALVVHPGNPVSSLSLDVARKIFQGDIHRWSDVVSTEGVAGPDRPIQTIGRLHCKLRPGHWRLLLDNEDLFSPGLVEVGTIPDMVSQVAANPDAIGHISPWFASHYYRDKGEVKILRLEGVSPYDVDALLEGRYPVYKTFSLTTWTETPAAHPEAQGVIRAMLQAVSQLDPSLGIIPASHLREAGWRFNGDELVGGPAP